MSEITRIRELVAKADQECRKAEAAEDAMRAIRLGCSPRIRERRRFWFGVNERAFTPYETSVLYEALQIVHNTHARRAAEYELQAVAPTSEEDQ